MKKTGLLPHIVALALLLSSCQSAATPTPTPPPAIDWADVYTDALLTRYPQDMESTVFGEAVHFCLQDLDLDGTPELLFSYRGVVNSVIFLGYTCRDGEIELIQFTENDHGWFPQEFALYRNRETGDLQWISHSSFRDGVGLYYIFHAFFDFSDLLHPTFETFLAYEERLLGEREGAEGVTYTLYHSDGSEEIVSRDWIDEQYELLMSPFEPVETQSPLIVIPDLLEENTDDPSATRFDEEKLRAFFETWDDTIPIPEASIDRSTD